jgi:hypothetical protein
MSHYVLVFYVWKCLVIFIKFVVVVYTKSSQMNLILVFIGPI